MSQRKYRLDVCPECKVREGISSRKRVYQCSYCERWFCKTHFEPRLVNIPDFKRIIKDVSWQNLIEKEWRRKDAHPDFQYTKERWQELRFAKELTWAKIEAFLNGQRGYGKSVSIKPQRENKCQVCGKRLDLPFRCSYCQDYFCVDHKLPENHQCRGLPKEPFWYPKRRKLAEATERRVDGCPKCGSGSIGVLSFDRERANLRCQICGYEWRQPRIVLKKEEMRKKELKELKPKKRKVIPRISVCPKCGKDSSEMIDYDAKTMTFECKECRHKYVQLKKFPYDIIESKDVLQSEEKLRTPKPKTKGSIRDTLLGILLGCAITLVGLGIIIWEIYNPLFWTIIFVWFIPIPLILIGGFLVLLGVIVTAGSVATYVGSLPPIRKIVALLLIIMILGVVLWNAPSIFSTFQKLTGFQPSSTYSHQELVNYALSLINSARMRHGVSNVSLSSIDSGQQHADNMLRYSFFSHWDTNGYKPHMRYTLAGGRGSVSENIAWNHYPNGIKDAKEAIENLERGLEMSFWHWANIVTAFHNKVSIGIAYDNDDIYLVQNFENDYITWSTVKVSDNEAIMRGTFQTEGLSIEHVAIYHDTPKNLTVQQLEKSPYNASYDMGTYVGMALPSGWESVGGITITAKTWFQVGRTFEIKFNLSPAFNLYGKGVYTLCLQSDLENTSTEDNSLTNYSVWYY